MEKDTKNALMSRTVWLGALVSALGALEALEASPVALPEWAMLVIGLLIIGLRSITSVPIRMPGRDQ